ncbi:hypothetical protein BVZ46_00879B, partial [Haemophilus influenzae]
SPMQKLI